MRVILADPTILDRNLTCIQESFRSHFSTVRIPLTAGLAVISLGNATHLQEYPTGSIVDKEILFYESDFFI